VKAFKTILVSLLTLALVSAASAAATDIKITGSTAYRAAAYSAIGHILKAGYTFGWVGKAGSSLNSSNEAIFHGFTSTGNIEVFIKTSFTGSVGGVAAIAGQLTIGAGGSAFGGGAFLADTNVLANGVIANPTFDAAETADITLSDAFQASAPTQYQTPALSGKIVGVVDFVWVKGVGASTSITNLTSTNAKLLLAGTLTEDKLFSGGKATTHVYAFGRDEDSGTRVAALADSGYGVHVTVQQYQPTGNPITSIALWPATTVDGIAYPVGDPGFSGGGALAAALLETNSVANTEFIGYLGLNDASTVGTSHWVQFDGKPITALTVPDIHSAVENGQYTFWGYEHFLYRGSTLSNPLAGSALTVALQLEGQILNHDANVSGVLISAMKFHRNSDGGIITTPGTPPNVP